MEADCSRLRGLPQGKIARTMASSTTISKETTNSGFDSHITQSTPARFQATPPNELNPEQPRDFLGEPPHRRCYPRLCPAGWHPSSVRGVGAKLRDGLVGAGAEAGIASSCHQERRRCRSPRATLAKRGGKKRASENGCDISEAVRGGVRDGGWKVGCRTMQEERGVERGVTPFGSFDRFANKLLGSGSDMM